MTQNPFIRQQVLSKYPEGVLVRLSSNDELLSLLEAQKKVNTYIMLRKNIQHTVMVSTQSSVESSFMDSTAKAATAVLMKLDSRKETTVPDCAFCKKKSLFRSM